MLRSPASLGCSLCLNEWMLRSAYVLCFFPVLVSLAPSRLQDTSSPVDIQVHADQADGTIPAVWSFFGYDEPNHTYAPNGKKLLGELSTLGPAPVASKSLSYRQV